MDPLNEVKTDDNDQAVKDEILSNYTQSTIPNDINAEDNPSIDCMLCLF
jgi:hypothetical protein